MTRNIPFFDTVEELQDFIYKDQLKKADSPVISTTTAFRNTIFGAKVWSQLNYEANPFALFGKEPWRQSGWRIETVSGVSYPSGAVAENATIPDTTKPTWVEVETTPKTVVHGFDTSEVAEFLSGVDDAVALLSELRKQKAKAHTRAISAMLIEDVATLGAGGAAGTANGNAIESIDRVISSYGEVTNCGDVTAGYSDVYSQDRDADTSDLLGAYVNHNSNTNRTLTLALIDTTLQNIWSNGGKPKFIITGYDSLMRWQQLLEAERRYLETARVVPTFAGVRGPAPGVEAGFMVATYHGIPVLPAQDQVTDGISRFHFVDSDYVHIRVAKPTQYFETEPGVGYLYLNQLKIEGAYRTMAELICQNFKAQGKLRDLQ